MTLAHAGPAVSHTPAELRSLGFALCKPDPGTKSPKQPGWSTRSLEPGDFAPADLVGILGGPLSDCNRPGHALVPIDLDAPEAVEKADAFLPPTAMQEGRPGKERDHRYYLVPCPTIPAWSWSQAEQGAAAAKAQKGHPGPWKKAFNHAVTGKRVLDFIGTGGQVVCPSAMNPRRWVGGEPGEPAVVPFEELWDAVCRLALACGAKLPFAREPDPPPERDGRGEWSGTEQDLIRRRVLPYLAKCDPAVSGAGGHDATYWPARVVCWGFALGAEVGFQVLWEHFNPRCSPPWSEAELRHKCRDADALDFGKPRGWLLDEPRPERNGFHGPEKESRAVSLPAPQPAAPDDNLTDCGNAGRLVQRHGPDLLYCHAWGKWLTWDGKRWELDATAEVVRRVKDTRRAFYQETLRALKALGSPSDEGDDEHKATFRKLSRQLSHCLAWEDAKRVKNTLEMAQSEVPVRTEALDSDPWLLTCLNGTIDLRTGGLRPHRREDRITKLSPVVYRPDASCELWLKFLRCVMADNEALVVYLQRVVGYGLTGSVREQLIWFLYGSGQNGKSTFLATVLAMLGDYGMQAVSDLLMLKHHESHPTERADLFGKRLVATIETEEGKRLAEALMKQLTGGDKIRARKMRQDHFEFSPTHKILLAANHKPAVRGTDCAVWRRIKLVPFAVTIREADKDRDLPAKLLAELPGILGWAVRGCLDWQRHGLGDPEAVRVATDDYRAEQDMLASFLASACVTVPEARVRSSALLDAYQEYSGDKWMTPVELAKRLSARGFESKKSGGVMWWHGVGLPAEEKPKRNAKDESDEVAPF